MHTHGTRIDACRAGTSKVIGYARSVAVTARIARSWPARTLASVSGLLLVSASPAFSAVVSPPAILYALGDSTGVGVGARHSYIDRVFTRMSEAGHSFRLQNFSESGATTSDVLHDEVGRIERGAHGLVLVGIGANDLTSGTASDVFGRQFEAIVAGVRARTDAPIVVSNIPDVSLAKAIQPAWRAPLAARVDAYNAVIAKVARERNLVVFDLCALTRQTLPTHPEYLSVDGFHPSDRGYEAWATGLWQVVRRVL
jgi:acyl-CoA thioesterase I